MKNLLKSTLSDRQIQRIRKVQFLSQLGRDELRETFLNPLWPSKPRSLNLLVNDVCNSRCQMCLIWKQKKDKEFTPEELDKILADDLFSHLQYVGVSGGEATLRQDLPELFKIICSKNPPILNTGIITNGLIEDVVKKQVLDCAEICKYRGIGFNVMVSLDGLGEVHDAVRGRTNNFDSALSLLNFFHKETDIPTSFGCTIVVSNAPYIDELLDYAKTEGLYGRFRIAEFINRLYNQDQQEFIRSFDEKLSYHLGLFFFRVEHDFETNLTFQKTYRNIRAMLIEGKPRQIGCPYQKQAVVLTSRGELLYCSPKSPTLGSALESSAKNLYFGNLSKRKQIIENDCQDCIHDYHEPIRFSEVIRNQLKTQRKQSSYDCQKLIDRARKLPSKKPGIEKLDSLDSERVLIVGWYGTETAGDKAILWTIVRNLRSRPSPPQEIYLASLYPFISARTLAEMGLKNITIVETYSREFEQACKCVDEAVVGGGPLMDIEELNHLLYAFIEAARLSAITRVEGCGIGPLKSPLYIEVVREILRLADDISLRDGDSVRRCLEEFGIEGVKTQCDPAVQYVEEIKTQLEFEKTLHQQQENVTKISCFLREWGRDYAGDLTEKDYQSIKNSFELELAKMVVEIARFKEADIQLLPMHSFLVGGDDRTFNRYLTQPILSSLTEQKLNCDLSFARQPLTPFEILKMMYGSQFNICMRFHSVLFAEILGVPYVAIDYTRGGKIEAFLKERKKLARLISLTDIAEGKWCERIKNVLEIT